ncbi:formate dehydrogenase accessory sulfurtransferase FdhD [Chitinophaga oryziterrae]|uniref:Sulfur carrier protein FdhD n=1 Tax=Chitinophaga oryziterrae TaxID=1031224 RepID=A0A6N8JJB6_9BACT|nr:formate dehydrogenase accessory sulfurtransferase FdhD [Chitinophaga oryziterrae]MVT44479.1 formate dehydrogenase accessory sulfurtransferase FdhD [Chitinophaga oryziterrae]
MLNPAISYTRITRVQDTLVTDTEDALAAEEPLEIRLVHGGQQQSITVTMRTPGQDQELAAGFLFTEGVISSVDDIAEINYADNIATVTLQKNVMPVLQPAQRNFFANSGCGVCGKTEITAIYAPVQVAATTIQCRASLLVKLPGLLRKQQAVFEDTGGLHASALFDNEGNLLIMREDIGRHNAVDKLVGTAMQEKLFPLHNYILLLSGRAGFELIQKAAMAGIKIIAAVGAPSSMAVKMAHEWDITLIGFLRLQRFNIYTGEERITV